MKAKQTTTTFAVTTFLLCYTLKGHVWIIYTQKIDIFVCGVHIMDLNNTKRIHNSKFWPIFPFKIAAFITHTQFYAEMYSYNHCESQAYTMRKRERQRDRFSTFANNSTIHFKYHTLLSLSRWLTLCTMQSVLCGYSIYDSVLYPYTKVKSHSLFVVWVAWIF